MPVLVVRVGHYPVHHGTVGVIRSLGRAGVAVYVVMEKGITPASTSRYLTGRFSLSSTREVDQAVLLERLVDALDQFPAPPLLVCTDDEAAVLVAEGRSELTGRAIFPPVPPDLVRRLASKEQLHEICIRHGVPTPAVWPVHNSDQFDAVLADLGLPVVVKQAAPWSRLMRPVVPSSTVVRDTEDVASLRARFDRWPEGSDVIVQEYLPDVDAEDWFAHGYCNHTSEVIRIFTGRKFWSWPPRAGATAYARTEGNEKLELAVRDLCRHVGYCGIFDTDWRYDRRSGTLSLLDFNPRVGAQFRMFEDDGGLDVVRVMHLDLTGRPIPPGNPVMGERFFVEHFGLGASRSYRGEPGPAGIPGAPSRVRLAWYSRDDLRPFFTMAVQQTAASIRTHLVPRRFRSSETA